MLTLGMATAAAAAASASVDAYVPAFGTPVAAADPALGVEGFAVGDFNCDGRPDMVLCPTLFTSGFE